MAGINMYTHALKDSVVLLFYFVFSLIAIVNNVKIIHCRPPTKILPTNKFAKTKAIKKKKNTKMQTKKCRNRTL